MEANSGRGNLANSILGRIDSQVMLDKLGAGGIVVVSAISAATGKVDDIRLQVVTTRQLTGFDRQKTVLGIIAGGSCLYDTMGEKFGDVPLGTFCLGGTANRFLPQPVYAMVGLGGPRIGTDYSLMLVGGEHAAIIRDISKLRVEPASGIPALPVGFDEFCLGVEQTMLRIAEESSPERLKAKKQEMINLICSELELTPERLTEELLDCSVEGIAAIGSFLFLAKSQGKLEIAFELVEIGFKGQWSYNHPRVRADPAYGSNRAFLVGLYQRAEVAIPRDDSEDSQALESL